MPDPEAASERRVAFESLRAAYGIDEKTETSLRTMKRLGNNVARVDILAKYGSCAAAAEALRLSVDATLPATFTGPRGVSKLKEASKADGILMMECYKRVFA
jgi:hypothetical protein